MVAIPDCVDNATQTDISFQNIVTLGRSRGHHHHHGRGGGGGGGSSSPPPPPPSPPLPHLVGPYGINELYVLTCCCVFLGVSRKITKRSILLDMMGLILPPSPLQLCVWVQRPRWLLRRLEPRGGQAGWPGVRGENSAGPPWNHYTADCQAFVERLTETEGNWWHLQLQFFTFHRSENHSSLMSYFQTDTGRCSSVCFKGENLAASMCVSISYQMCRCVPVVMAPCRWQPVTVDLNTSVVCSVQTWNCGAVTFLFRKLPDWLVSTKDEQLCIWFFVKKSNVWAYLLLLPRLEVLQTLCETVQRVTEALVSAPTDRKFIFSWFILKNAVLCLSFKKRKRRNGKQNVELEWERKGRMRTYVTEREK